MDASKAIIADPRHRALRHHAEGIFALEHEWGVTITNSDGHKVPVRLIGELHVVEDLGFVPSFADWARLIAPAAWVTRGNPKGSPGFDRSITSHARTLRQEGPCDVE